MKRHRRLTATLAGLLVLPTVVVVQSAVSDSASATLPAPVILNTGLNSSADASWLESGSLPDAGAVRSVTATFLVTHAVGRSITGVRVDADWNGSDNTSSGTLTAVTQQAYTPAAGGMETSRVTANISVPNGPNLSGRAFHAPIRMRVVDNTGEQSATVTNEMRFVEDGNSSGSQDFPRLKSTNAAAVPPEIAPGGALTVQYSCDDVDSNVSVFGVEITKDDECAGAQPRWRRLNDGVTFALATKTGGSDNSTQTLTVNAPTQRGYYVLETLLCNENGDCPTDGNGSGSSAYWRLGAAVVNNPASTLSASIGFTGMASSSPPSVNAGAAASAVATVGDSGGAGSSIQVLEWDADGNGTYERSEYTVPTNSGGNITQPALTSTELTQALNTSAYGLKTVQVRGTDNGGIDAADNARRQISESETYRVNAIPTAANVTAATNEDNAVVVNLSGADADNQPDPLTYSIVSGPAPAAGTLGSVSGNHVTFTPALNFNGTATFTYQAADGTGSTVGAHHVSNVATATITVHAVNDLPTVDPNSLTTDEDTAGTVHMTGSDVEDGGNLSFTAADGAHGTVTCDASDDCTYTPAADFNGSDSFVVTGHDTEGGTGTATVTVVVNPVNDAPVATDDTVNVPEDSVNFPINLAAGDIDSGVLTFSAPDADVSHGTLSCVGGACIYSPDHDYDGPDSFTFTVSDGALTDSGTITIDVTAVNDAPVATDVTDAVTDEDVAVAIPADGTDVDGDTVTVASATDPANGTANVTGANEVTYQGDQDFNGVDTYDFTVVDGNGGSDVGHVMVTVNPVNDAPVVGDQAFTVDEDAPQIVSMVASDVDGDLLDWSIVDQGSHGHVVGTGPDAIYVPDHDFHGDDTFTVQVSDGQAADTATITIHVSPVNDQPVADSATVTTSEDTSTSFTLAGSDVDGDGLTYTVGSTTSNGGLSCADEACTYQPDADFNGADHLTFTVSDGSLTDSASVTIVVTPVNDDPVALPTLVDTDEDTPVAVPLHVTDVDGDAVTYSVGDPAFGTIEGIAPDLVYVPNLNASGVETISYSVDDGHSGTAGNVIGITVHAVNDAPVATGGSVATAEDTPVAFQLGATDVEGDALTFTVDTAPPASAGLVEAA